MVALAYFLIPLLLLDCLQWRPNLLDQGIFWLLCAFFITGGMTHFMQEQRQVETERRESNQRLSLLVKQTPLAVIEWTINFEVADWNPAAEKIFGYSKREALGSHAVKLMVPENAKKHVNQVWQQLLLQQGGTRSANENITKEGRKIYCEWYNAPLINSEGQVIGVASLVQDITEEKLAQEALQQAKNQLEIRVEERTQELKQAIAQLQSEIDQRQQVEAALVEREEQYRSAVDNVKEVIFQTDASGLWTFLNPAWIAITGFAIADSLGTRFLDYVHPDDKQRHQEQLKPLFERNKEYCRHEVRYLTAYGDFRWIEVLAQLTFDAEGTITGTCGTLNDISERKQVEAALRISEEHFRQLTENIHEVFFLTTPDFSQILYISPAYEEVWDRTTQSLYEQPNSWLDSVHPKDRDRVITALTRQLEGKQDFEEEYRIVRPGGSVRWVWVRAFQVLNEAGSLERIAGIAEDITERKRAQAEILNALLREKELGDLKSRFVSITSHEFRTPLTTIMSTTELLEYYEWTREEQLEQLHEIQDAVKQMLQLLEDLLFIGTADAGQIRFNPEQLDLNQFCRDLVAEIQRGVNLKPAPAGTEHTLSFVSYDSTFLACMDKKLLRQMLSNLLLNAIKYSPCGGTIQIELACEGDQAIFEIQDQGIGIPKEDQGLVFEFFHRAKNVGAIAGTGLGLAIVKRCVDLHEGYITVNSEVGVGTQFTVMLPLNNPHLSHWQCGKALEQKEPDP